MLQTNVLGTYIHMHLQVGRTFPNIPIACHKCIIMWVACAVLRVLTLLLCIYVFGFYLVVYLKKLQFSVFCKGFVLVGITFLFRLMGPNQDCIWLRDDYNFWLNNTAVLGVIIVHKCMLRSRYFHLQCLVCSLKTTDFSVHLLNNHDALECHNWFIHENMNVHT